MGENERNFRLRTEHAAREARDEQVERLRGKYQPKLQTLNDRLQRAHAKLEQEKQQASSQTLQSVISIGSSLLGAFMGRKTISAANINRIGTAARSASRIGKERGDVGLAEETVESLQQQIQDLSAELEQEIATIPAPAQEALETITVKAKKTNITVQLVALAWV